MPGKQNLILDTDIDTDCDDAGALAVLFALANRGAVAPLGVVCSVPLPECAACVHAINRWHGFHDLPVGVVRIRDWETARSHRAYLAHRAVISQNGTRPLYNTITARNAFGDGPPPATEDAVVLYRRLLASADDGSVVICAIGTLSALARLLASEADKHSPLCGAELVRRKVDRLVTMAVAPPPDGREAFNWRMDLPAAAAVIRGWPTPIHVSSHGKGVLAGPRILRTLHPANPVRTAYESFLDWLGESARPSWDHLAVLCAANCAEEWFRAEKGYRLTIDARNGVYRWREDDRGPGHAFLRPTAAADDATMGRYVEALMIEADPKAGIPPDHGRVHSSRVWTHC